jgi:hypothetical protein
LSPTFETILISSSPGPEAKPLIILIEPVPPARTVIKPAYGDIRWSIYNLRLFFLDLISHRILLVDPL